jgi:hypothetical protein
VTVSDCPATLTVALRAAAPVFAAALKLNPLVPVPDAGATVSQLADPETAAVHAVVDATVSVAAPTEALAGSTTNDGASPVGAACTSAQCASNWPPSTLPSPLAWL